MSLHLSTKKIMILFAAANVLAVLGYVYVFNLLQARNTEITALNKEVEAFAATDASLGELQQALNETETEVALVESFYVSADGAIDFLETIESLARLSGVTFQIESVTSEEVSKETKNLQEKIILRIETGGSWQDTYNFLLLADNLPYKTEFEGVNLERIENAPGQDGRPAGHYWKADIVISVLKLIK